MTDEFLKAAEADATRGCSAGGPPLRTIADDVLVSLEEFAADPSSARVTHVRRPTPEQIAAHREEMLACGYCVVPMPVNAKGQGPCDESEAVKTYYEVWDACHLSVVSCETREEAEWVVTLADRLNAAAKRIATLEQELAAQK